jgi:hypothetical protein
VNGRDWRWRRHGRRRRRNERRRFRQLDRFRRGRRRHVRRWRRSHAPGRSDGRRFEQLRRVGNVQIPEIDGDVFVSFSGAAARHILNAPELPERTHIVDVRVVAVRRPLQFGIGGRGAGCLDGRGHREEIAGHLIVVGNLAAANLDPDIVATPGGNHREAFARKLGQPCQFLLDGAKFVEGTQSVGRQQLRHDAVDGFERQAAAGQLNLSGGGDDVGFVARVHDQRFAVHADNCLKQ